MQVEQRHRWLDIAITNINAGHAQVYQTCMLVGASLTDIWLGTTVKDKWSDAIVTAMTDGWVQM